MVSILATALLAAAFACPTHGQNSTAIPAAIEKPHQDDIIATIARDADGLAALWDDDAVLLQPGRPPIVGKAAFHDFVKQDFAKSPTAKVLKYMPNIRDIQVADNLAYEWGCCPGAVEADLRLGLALRGADSILAAGLLYRRLPEHRRLCSLGTPSHSLLAQVDRPQVTNQQPGSSRPS